MGQDLWFTGVKYKHISVFTAIMSEGVIVLGDAGLILFFVI